MPEAYDTFLSYTSQDGEIAEAIQQALEERRLRVFRDTRSIAAGANFVLSINDALSVSRSVVLLISPAAMDSPWVNHEWATALCLALERGGSARIIPAMVRSGALLPVLLRPLRFVDFRPPAEFARSIEDLVQAIEGRAPVLPLSSQAPPEIAFLAFFPEGLLPGLYSELVAKKSAEKAARTAEEAGVVKRVQSREREMIGLDPAYLQATWAAIEDKPGISRELLAMIDSCLDVEDPFAGMVTVGRGRAIFLRDLLELVALTREDEDDVAWERRERFRDLARRLVPLVLEEGELRVALEISFHLLQPPFLPISQDLLLHARILTAIGQPEAALEFFDPLRGENFFADGLLTRRQRVAALRDWAKAMKDAGLGRAAAEEILAGYGEAISLAQGAPSSEDWDPRFDIADLLLNRATQLAVFGNDEDWHRAQADLEQAQEIYRRIGEARGLIAAEIDRIALTLDRLEEGERPPECLLASLGAVEEYTEKLPAEDLFLFLFHKSRLLQRLGRLDEADLGYRAAEQVAAQDGLRHRAPMARLAWLRLQREAAKISGEEFLQGLRQGTAALAAYPEDAWARNTLRRDLPELARILCGRQESDGAWRAAVQAFELEARKLRREGSGRSARGFRAILNLMAEIDPNGTRRREFLRDNAPQLRRLTGKPSYAMVIWDELEQLIP